MKKLSKLLLVAVLALGMGLTACNNDDLPGGPDAEKGNTHVSVALKLSSNNGAGTRDLPNDYNYVGKWAGKDKIEKITVYLVDGASVNSSIFSVAATGADYDITTTGNDILLKPNTNAAIKTTAGQKTVYVVVNENVVVRDWLNKTPVHEFEQAYQNLPLVLANEEASAATSASKVASINGQNDETIVMTNVKPATITVAAGVSAEQTINDATKNRASLQVERMVARAMVTIKETPQGGFSIPDPNTNGATSLGSLTDITWVVAQGENSLFVQHKADNNPWEWATPNWDWVPSSANYYTDAGSKYDYSGLFEARANKFGGTDVPTYADYANTKDDDPIELETRWLDGKFVLPTTHEYAAAPADAGSYTGGYKKGNTAYVLIRAKFTPAAGAWADKGTKATDGTFYVGENGKFYTSAQAAYDDMGTTKMTKYEGGKVLYYAWLNPDQIPNWYNSPVLRNNIYHIHITGFKNLGTNWNPLYPEDPTVGEPTIPNPKADPSNPEYDPNEPPFIDNPNYDPKNPDPKPTPDPIVPEGGGTPITPEEPTNPIDPEDPLTTSETWMSVEVSILPWLVHSYQVDLGI